MLSDNLKEETESTERGWKKYKKEIADYIPCTYKEEIPIETGHGVVCLTSQY